MRLYSAEQDFDRFVKELMSSDKLTPATQPVIRVCPYLL